MRLLRMSVALIFAASSGVACIATVRLPGSTTQARPVPAVRNPPGSSLVVNRDFGKLSKTIPGLGIEVTTSESRLWVGNFVSADADSLTMKIDLRHETFKRDDIVEVSAYETQKFPFAFGGAAVGMFGGLWATGSRPPSTATRVSAMVGGALVGVIAGVFIGDHYLHHTVLYARR